MLRYRISDNSNEVQGRPDKVDERDYQRNEGCETVRLGAAVRKPGCKRETEGTGRSSEIGRHHRLEFLHHVLLAFFGEGIHLLSKISKNSFLFKISVASFAAFVLSSEKNILTPQVAFVSLALFNILRAPMNFLPAIIAMLVQVLLFPLYCKYLFLNT